MTDELQLLIQSEIDGTNAPEDSARLQRQIASDPAARALYDDLTRVAALLDAMPTAELPPGLATRLAAGLPDPRRAPPVGWSLGGWLRLGYGVAAVGLVGVLAYYGFLVGPGAPVIDPDALTGSMVAPRPSGEVVVGLDAPGLGGSVRASRNGTMGWLLLEIDTAATYRVELGVDPRQVDVLGLARDSDDGLTLETGPTGAVVRGEGPQNGWVLLRVPARDAFDVEVAVLRSGAPTYTKTLQIPAETGLR